MPRFYYDLVSSWAYYSDNDITDATNKTFATTEERFGEMVMVEYRTPKRLKEQPDALCLACPS